MSDLSQNGYVHVTSNGVTVGSMSLQQYRTICASTRSDWSVLLRQGIAWLRILSGALISAMIATAILAFWVAVAVALVAPDSFRAAVRFPYDHPGRFAVTALAALAGLFVIETLRWLLRSRAATFFPVIDSEINSRIRASLKLAVPGDYVVSVFSAEKNEAAPR